MSIILTRNLVGEPVTDFAAAVKAMAQTHSHTGTFDFIYIVPTRRRVRELQRDLVQDICFGKVPIYTLELLAHEILNSLSVERRVISPSVQGTIISQILADGEFRFFKFAAARPGARKGMAPPGTIKKIVDQITYLEENGITPQDYKTMLAAAEETEIQKLSEFLSIYSEYINRLDNHLVDNAGVLSLVNHEIEQAPDIVPQLFPGRKDFLVEGFYNFKLPELDFLRMLSANKNFSFLIRLDCNEANPDLFRTMIETSDELTKRGFARVPENGTSVSDGMKGIRDLLGEHLFSDKRPDTRINLKDKAFIAAARDKLREAEIVAEKIKELIENSPSQPLHRICVVSYLPQDYSAIFREVFTKYRIPANITDRYTLESNGVVNAILSFIEISLSDYERNSLVKALTNRSVTIDGHSGPDLSGSVIHNAALLCRFERGKEAFKGAIAARLQFLHKLGHDKTEDNDDQNEKEIKILERAGRVLNFVEMALEGFNDELTPTEFRKEVGSLVDKLSIRRNIVAGEADSLHTDLAERDARALTSFFDVLDELVQAETDRGTGKLGLALWMDNLRSALTLTRYNVRQKYGYGVYVTSLEEIRGLDFDYLFIVGLSEGELPSKYDPEILLPLQVQKENRELTPYLQRYLFYQAASSFEKELYLIHPTRRNEIRLARSSFIDALEEIAEVGRFDRVETPDGGSSIYNMQDLIQAYAMSNENRETIRQWDSSYQLLPSNIDRCITAEAARFGDRSESEFHGKITDPAVAGLINADLSERIYSSSQIESLARCGFQFFTRRILKIVETPEVDISLTPIERGAVLHKILYEYYSELARTGKISHAAKEIDVLKSKAEEVLKQFGISSNVPGAAPTGKDDSGRRRASSSDLYEIERDMILGTEYIPGTLDLFLSKVQAKLSEFGFVPESFELSFGARSADTAVTSSVRIGDSSFRGKIDRVDNSPDGAIIFDYKTSSVLPSHKDVVRDKISPQLLIYMNSLNTASSGMEERKPPAGAAYISINRDKLLNTEDGNKAIKFIVTEEDGELKYSEKYHGTRGTRMPAYPTTMRNLMKETEEFVERITGEAKSGRFNLTKFSWDRVCKYCPYSHACRVALRGEGDDRFDESA